MTTEHAAREYLAEHMSVWGDRGNAVYNPNGEPVESLPIIYGFNNGGSPDWYSAVLMAEDGTYLGGHCCSHESYMPHDLGILNGSRPDRHETFRAHYPNGYRMEFVGARDVRQHFGLIAAYDKNQAMPALKGAAE